MKINFKDFILHWIDWKPVVLPEDQETIYQIIWSKIWNNCTDLTLANIAEAIYRGEEVELNSQQVEFIKGIFTDQQKSWLNNIVGLKINLFIDSH